jgi:signal transduction histidine kinase
VTISDQRFDDVLGPAAPIVRAVFEALPDAIAIHWPVRDADGAVIDFELGYSNPSGARVIGVDLSADVGERLLEVMPGIVELGVYERLVRVVEGATVESSEIEFDTPYRGQRLQATWMHTVLPFGDGVMSIVFDLSDERRRERELRDFAHVAAHDLREPLTSVHLLAGLLSRRAVLSPKDEEVVAMIRGGVDRARSMVDGILEYATADGDSEDRRVIDSAALVADVVACLEAQIASTAGTVEVAELPTVRASPGALARVFQNLIANALKFHDGQAPIVHVSAARADANWTFAVRDNGIGLPPTTDIFEMFTRGAGDHEGSGVGLATCRRIVEAHGGRIWAEPVGDGGGSTFSFTLPD